MSTAKDTIDEHADDLEEAASGRDAPAGVVVLAALANNDHPPQWAIDDLEDRAQ